MIRPPPVLQPCEILSIQTFFFCGTVEDFGPFCLEINFKNGQMAHINPPHLHILWCCLHLGTLTWTTRALMENSRYYEAHGGMKSLLEVGAMTFWPGERLRCPPWVGVPELHRSCPIRELPPSCPSTVHGESLCAMGLVESRLVLLSQLSCVHASSHDRARILRVE